MRTTLDIDDDILEAVKEIAASRATTAGRVLSDLARNPSSRSDIRACVTEFRCCPGARKGAAGRPWRS